MLEVLQLYLDFINLFLLLIQFLGQRRRYENAPRGEQESHCLGRSEHDAKLEFLMPLAADVSKVR